MPLIESMPLTMTLVLEVDGHRLEFTERVRSLQGARYHGADPREQGYSTDNSLETRIRASTDALTAVLVERARITVQRLYPVAGDRR